MKFCNDDNQKVFEIEFDTGSLQKEDVWHLCKNCSLKPEFKYHRIRIRGIVN